MYGKLVKLVKKTIDKIIRSVAMVSNTVVNAIHKITYRVRTFVGRIIIKSRGLHMFFSINYNEGNLSIVLNERYENAIKWTSRTLLVAGIIFSFISIPSPYSIFISLGLIVIEQIVERIVFSFNTMVIVSMPSSEVWQKANFQALITAIRPGTEEDIKLGMLFADTEAAKQVFEHIRSWNYGHDTDEGEGNIVVSIVINYSKDSYAFFVYPSMNRTSFNVAYEAFQKAANMPNKTQKMMIAHLTIAKLFPNYSQSALNFFLKHYKDGSPYVFMPWYMTQNHPMPMKVKPIIKNRLRVLDISQLTKTDLEKHFCDYIIDWNDPEKVPPASFWKIN